MLKRALGKYEWGLFDQNGFTYVLKTWPVAGAAKRKVHLETSYYLNGYWKDVPVDRLDEIQPFVKHYMGCQFCSGINRDTLDACQQDFDASYVWANDRMQWGGPPTGGGGA